MKTNSVSKKAPRLTVYDFYEGIKYPRLRRLVVHFVRDWQLHLLMLLPVVYRFIFDYIPMYGVQIAFRSYSSKLGIVDSEWVGLKWILRFVDHYEFGEMLWNTLRLSLYSLAVGFPLPILFALMLNAMRKEKLKKVVQTVAYMPHFISTVVLVSIVNMVFSPINGIYGNLYRLFGGVGFPTDFRALPETFPHMYVWSGVWANLGWNTILYTAALSGVSQELHEAAVIDGASRWQRVFHIDLPSILPTVCIKLILAFDGILSVGYEKVYLMQSPLNLDVSEVISTYVFKIGLSSVKQFSSGSAIGLFNTLVSLVLMLTCNKIVDKLSDSEIGLF